MLESWAGFKEAITIRFARKILFHIALQKIEARKWNINKESFLNYALEKLTLMHSLKLQTKEIMHLLINGVTNRLLRATAAIQGENLDKFLDDIQSIKKAAEGEEEKSFMSQRRRKTTCAETAKRKVIQ